MKSSNCGFIEQGLITHHRKKSSSGAHFRGTLWRAETCCVQSPETQSKSTDTLGRYFKFPKLPTVELLTPCFLHSSQLFSTASKTQTAWLPAAAVFVPTSIKTKGVQCRKLGETSKVLHFHSDLRTSTANIQRKISVY